jgi:type II secretory pathway component GspD/PulD (secretin)
MKLYRAYPALLLLLSLIFASALQAAPRTEVIPLNYRTADELLPVVQSTLGSEGKVSAYGNQLIVNAESNKITEIKSLLSQLDTQPHRLLITVDTRDADEGDEQGYSVNGRLGSHPDTQVRIISNSTGTQQDGTQQVQATEGSPALVKIGQSVPISTTEIDPYGRPYTRTEYRDLNRGFYVTASLTGNLVHLTIGGGNNSLDRNQPNTINTQSTSTRVSGRLGEWIALSGFSQNAARSEDGILYEYSTRGSQDTQLRVKVDLLD